MGTMLRGVLLLLGGLAALSLAIGQCLERGRFLESAERTSGTVWKLNAGGSHPDIQFTTADGQKVSYPQGGLIFGYSEGMQVSVLFDPENPRQSAVLDTFGAIWALPLVFGTIGAVIFFGGLWTFWLGVRRYVSKEE